jgi:hypothetical protein
LFLILLSMLGSSAPVTPDPVRVLEQGDTGVTVGITVPAPVFAETVDGFYPVLPGAGLSSAEGDCLRPVYSFCVPVPPSTEPVVEYSIDATAAVRAPEGDWARTPVLEGTGLDLRETVPRYPPPGPVSPVDVHVMRIAGTDMAVVTVLPFSGTSPDRYASRVTVSLEWPRTGGSVPAEGTLAGLVALPGLGMWMPDRTDSRGSPFWGRPWARISLDATGFYSITGEELDDHGIDVVGAPSATLSLWSGPGLQFDLSEPDEEHGLSPVSMLVEDGGDGVFDTGDSLIFFALALDRFEPDEENTGMLHRLHHRYATHNVYWLTWGGETGSRMDTLQVTPDGSPAWGDSLDDHVWLEQEIVWVPEWEERTGWVWSSLWQNVPGYFYFSTPSPDGPARLAIQLVADAAGMHELEVRLGSQMLADTSWSWSGETELVLDGVPVTQGLNQLKITVVGGPGSVYLDCIHASWPRRLLYGTGRQLFFAGAVPGRYLFELGGADSTGNCALFDASDPREPVLLAGYSQEGNVISFSHHVDGTSRLMAVNPGQWLSPDSLQSASPGRILGAAQQGDAAIVVADELLQSASGLLDLYSGRGVEPVMVTAGEVYDEFGQGVRDPGAIRSFFRFTQDGWSTPAGALLLVGDGNYDPLMHVTADRTLIPAYIELGDDEGILSEDFFVEAHQGSTLPEAPVSRIPVDNAAELVPLVHKLARYHSGAAAGEWCNQAVLVADDEWGNSSSDEVLHTKTCELLADSLLPRDLNREKFYLIEYPWPPGTTPSSMHPIKPQARQDLIARLSEGCSAFVFFGHGSYGQIAHEKLLVTSDLGQIQNGDRLPLACFATCNIGQFDLISTDCMGEEFALKPDGGSIATIAATRGTYSIQNQNLYLSIFDELYNGDGVTIGEALWAGKIANPTVTRNRLNVLLGDGGIELLRPAGPGADIRVAGGEIDRGRVNSVSTWVPEPATGWLRVTESGAWTTYICLLNSTELTWLRYGDDAYRGMIGQAQPDTMHVDFFMPVQADTGSYGRCSMVLMSGDVMRTAYREWADVVDIGGYPPDSTGPEMLLRVNGLCAGEGPEVRNPVELTATISDPSGICVLGGAAGRAILLSLDSQGFDLSRYFMFRPGSYTTGDLEFPLPEMLEGSHRVIVAAWDGLGNGSQDTLDFQVLPIQADLLGQVFVYPNPGSGMRAFSFQAAAPGSFEIRVYTVGGRCIWSAAGTAGQGYNQVVWDGLDADGDAPGSGTYIYRLELDTQQSGSASVTDVFAVVRE